MKKIIALALALIMALSMGVVAFAAEYRGDDRYNTTDIMEGYKTAPGSKLTIITNTWDNEGLKGYKVSYDFTKSEGGVNYMGASLVESVKIAKDKESLVLTLKESYTATTEKAVVGKIVLEKKDAQTYTVPVSIKVNNNVVEIQGAKKAVDADDYTYAPAANQILVMDEDGGYISFVDDSLTGVVKMAAEEKTFFNFAPLAGDELEAFEEALGEDFDGIVETYAFETRAFKNDVDFRYDAYEDDPHFFYKWDGEKFTAIDAKYDADEDVDDYVFTTTAEDTIVVSDVELVVAAEEETKNPDTGANDVVGVAAALAVVSLVAAGAVSLKK